MRKIEVKKDLRFSLDKVWQSLVDPGSLSVWLMPTDFVARPGAKFTFTEPGHYVSGEVLEVVENQTLSLFWLTKSRQDDDDAAGTPSVVTFKVSPTKTGGTRLEFEQEFLVAPKPVVLIESNLNWRFAIQYSLVAQLRKVPVPIVYGPIEEESEEVRNRRAGFRQEVKV